MMIRDEKLVTWSTDNGYTYVTYAVFLDINYKYGDDA